MQLIQSPSGLAFLSTLHMLVQILYQLGSVAKTLHLFNKSDIKTIVFPVSVFSLALANSRSLDRFAIVVFWIWLDLLQFTVANQSFGNSPDEDALNKPNRPIPAKRISLATAKVLRWLLVPIMLVYSMVVGGLKASIGIAVLTLIYNEANGAGHWIPKNVCCAGFYAAFEYGATLIADQAARLSAQQLSAIVMSALIIFTTIHAQDFRDNEGDALMGRKTFPLAFPTFSRLTMPLTLVPWSLTLFYMSTVHVAVLYGLVALSIGLGIRFLTLKTAEEDRFSYLLYNIWLCMAHIALSGLDKMRLPVF